MQGYKIQGKRRKVNIGDMCMLINIENRNIVPSATDTEYSLDFTDKNTDQGVNRLSNGEVWSNHQSVKGVTIFDKTGNEIDVTDYFYMRYLDITTEQWVRYNNKRYDIVNIENFDERDEFLRLDCVFKGPIVNYNNVI